MRRNTDLAQAVRRSLERYFRDLGEEQPTGLWAMVMKKVEKPLLETVLARAGGNRTLAAAILGIDRNTLRKKLREHRLR